MINATFGDFDYQLLPKRQEQFDKYCKIIQWGRKHPTRFIEDFFKIQLSDHQKWIIMNTWIAQTSTWLCSRATGKALELDTPVYFYGEDGEISKKPLREVSLGDMIIDENGKSTEVVHLNPIIFEYPYKISFDDGEVIKCNSEHLWATNAGVITAFEIKKLMCNGVELYIPTVEFDSNNKVDKKLVKSDKVKKIVKIELQKELEAMRCITVSNHSGLFLCGDKFTVTHNSFMAAIFIMARTLLFPNTNAYIMGPSGGQSAETFMKLESIATGNIASLIGTSTVFLDECKRQNIKASPFTHDKSGYNVTLNNGSSINSLNSVAKNLVGIRSHLNVYDEAGKIDRNFYSLTLPFTAQNMDFITGSGINVDVYPRQMQNKNLFLSSAEGIDSYLYDMYKLCFKKMLVGDPSYFVADLDCSFSLCPFINGKPSPPLLQQKVIDDAMATNPYRAQREYYNRFDRDGGEDVFVKRSTIIKYSETYYPEYENDTTKKYIIAYDPSSKVDNSIISVFEMFRHPEKGLMLKLVNCVNLIELLPSGDKAVIQKPEQIEILKKMILDYNKGALDYDNIENVSIDAGSGGGGFDISAFILGDWKGYDGKMHLGLIDPEDPYQKLRMDDYPGAVQKLRLVNFKKSKVEMYERCQAAVNQGLIVFPNSLNVRNELEISETLPDGTVNVRYEKVSFSDMNVLIQVDLMKEEVVSMEKQKKPNGTVVFELSGEAKSRNMHDDRVDTLAMAASYLMEQRAKEALEVEQKPSADFKNMFERQRGMTPHMKKVANSFNQTGGNPFLDRRRPS